MAIKHLRKYTFIFCSITLCTLLAAVKVGWAVDAVKTEGGSVLNSTNETHTDVKKQSVEPVRDIFNWTPETIEMFQAIFVEEVDTDFFSGLKLNGVLWDDTKPIAIINDMVVQEGDLIQGVTVTKIFQEKVLLLKENRQHSLEFTMGVDLDTLFIPPMEK